MNLKDLEEFSKRVPGKLLFDYNLNKKKELAVGNIIQTGIFHYVEDNFINKQIMENLK